MTKQIAFILIIVLRIAIHPSHDQKQLGPFASPSPLPTSTIPASPAEVFRTNANERLIKKWVTGDNRPGLCYNSLKAPVLTKKNAANTFVPASSIVSNQFLNNKS